MRMIAEIASGSGRESSSRKSATSAVTVFNPTFRCSGIPGNERMAIIGISEERRASLTRAATGSLASLESTMITCWGRKLCFRTKGKDSDSAAGRFLVTITTSIVSGLKALQITVICRSIACDGNEHPQAQVWRYAHSFPLTMGSYRRCKLSVSCCRPSGHRADGSHSVAHIAKAYQGQLLGVRSGEV